MLGRGNASHQITMQSDLQFRKSSGSFVEDGLKGESLEAEDYQGECYIKPVEK